MNEHYIKSISEDELYDRFVQYCELYKEKIPSDKENKIKPSLTFLKNKAKTLEDIYNNAKYIIFDEVSFNQDDLKLIDDKAKKIISEFSNRVNNLKVFNKETLEPVVNNLIKTHETNFKGVGQPLRIALTGSKFGPGIYDIIISLGSDETLKRLNKII
jgi:glutamyl-tRNA synthetase